MPEMRAAAVGDACDQYPFLSPLCLIREFDKNQNKKQILSHSCKAFICLLSDFLFEEFHSRMLATERGWASLRAAFGLL